MNAFIYKAGAKRKVNLFEILRQNNAEESRRHNKFLICSMIAFQLLSINYYFKISALVIKTLIIVPGKLIIMKIMENFFLSIFIAKIKKLIMTTNEVNY